MSQNLTEEAFNVLAHFFCQQSNASDLPKINPHQERIPAWRLWNEQTIAVRFQGKPGEAVNLRSGQDKVKLVTPIIEPEKRFVHPSDKNGDPPPSNFQQAAIYQVTCRRYANTTGECVGLALIRENKVMSETQGTEETDRVLEAAKVGKARMFDKLEPTHSEEGMKDISALPMPNLNFGLQNIEYMRTFAYVTKENIWNGLVHIPPEVCQKAGLPLWQGHFQPDEETVLSRLRSMKLDAATEEGKVVAEDTVRQFNEDKLEEYAYDIKGDGKGCIRSYYAIPIDHILAWPYRSEELAMQCKHRFWQFRYRPHPKYHKETGPDPILLYYIVPDVLVKATIKESLEAKFIGKVDLSPLGEAGFEFIDLVKDNIDDDMQPYDVNGHVTIQATISYLVARSLGPGTIKNLYPGLSPNFPPSWHWCDEAVIRDALLNS